MSFDTTINFSIPSACNGETDATGLCTIKLLNNLTVSIGLCDVFHVVEYFLLAAHSNLVSAYLKFLHCLHYQLFPGNPQSLV